MGSPEQKSDLARLTGDEFSSYFEHLAQRVDHFVHAVPAGSLWTKPFPFGNSIGHLVLHLTGNLNHYIGAIIVGSGYEREREKEFTDPVHPPVEVLLSQFHQAVAMVKSTLLSLDDDGFQVAVEHNVPDSHAAWPLSRLPRAHEQSHRPDELSRQALKSGNEQKAQW